jgi:hypothetical protein
LTQREHALLEKLATLTSRFAPEEGKRAANKIFEQQYFSRSLPNGSQKTFRHLPVVGGNKQGVFGNYTAEALRTQRNSYQFIV